MYLNSMLSAVMAS